MASQIAIEVGAMEAAGISWLLLLLRSVHSHHRFDVQTARQVAGCDPPDSPGFIDFVANKKAEFVRIYLPLDANTLLSVTDHCLRSRNYVNVIVAGKQASPQWLDMDAAVAHCTAGIGIWPWASNDHGSEPDVVMACCGDVPTLETLAAVELLRESFPR